MTFQKAVVFGRFSLGEGLSCVSSGRLEFDNIYSGRDNGMLTNDTWLNSKISGISHVVSLCLIYVDSGSCGDHVL